MKEKNIEIKHRFVDEKWKTSQTNFSFLEFSCLNLFGLHLSLPVDHHQALLIVGPALHCLVQCVAAADDVKT